MRIADGIVVFEVAVETQKRLGASECIMVCRLHA